MKKNPAKETKTKKPVAKKKDSHKAIKDDLCQLISHSSKSIQTCLNEIKCKRGYAPQLKTVFNWLHSDKDFLQQYAHAKEEQAEYLVEEMLAIADDDSQDELFLEANDESGKSAKRVCNNEFVQRSRLRVDTRKWIASKLKPKKFGEKLEVDTPEGKPLIMVVSAAGTKPDTESGS